MHEKTQSMLLVNSYMEETGIMSSRMEETSIKGSRKMSRLGMTVGQLKILLGIIGDLKSLQREKKCVVCFWHTLLWVILFVFSLTVNGDWVCL